MKSLVKGVLGAAVMLGLAAPMAEALPLAPLAPAVSADSGLVTTVRDGCGPGRHRGPGGFCRPNFGPRPFFGGPRFYGRRCFILPTPFGPRRVCRY